MLTLWQWQKEVLQWSLNRDYIGLLLQQRLGKSLIAKRWAEAKGTRALIVAPKSTHLDWIDLIKADGGYCCYMEGSTHKKMQALKASDLQADFYLINPEGLRACPDLFYEVSPDVLILDESIVISNAKAKQTKVLLKLAKEVRYRAILTGELMPDSYEQTYTQLSFLLASGFMGISNFWTWRTKYFLPDFWGHNYEPRLGAGKEIKEAVAKHCYTLRAKDVGREVKRINQIRTVDTPGKILKLYEKAKREWVLGESSTKWNVSLHNWLTQLASGLIPGEYEKDKNFYLPYKIRYLIEELHGNFKNESMVIWCRYIREINMVYRELVAAGITATKVSGTTSMDNRKKRLTNFRTGKKQVLVMQYVTGMMGLNLSNCSVMVYHSTPYTRRYRGQLDARCDSMNKEEPTLILDLVAAGTVEERAIRILQDKAIKNNRVTRHLKELVK